ncbi:MAG: FadR family transcriptional regulator [Synergistaceae bacterium]|jgi:GntR family transcriptional repressor for pyruvate dehydrogenase complex|nr:FadR family transcriptional regulator [Synergistaceae bacterium]
MFKEVQQKSSLIEDVIDQVLSAIESEQMPPGSRLPTERELTEQLKVSRPVVREATSSLAALGVVERKGAKGTYLSSDVNASLIKKLFSYMVIRGSELNDVREITDTRRAIESELIALASERRTQFHLEEMESALDKMDGLDIGTTGWFQMDYRFHSLIGEAANSKFLLTIQTSIREKMLHVMELAFFPPQIEQLRLEHREMFAAIEAKLPERGRKVAIQHIELVTKGIVQRQRQLEIDALSVK